MKNNTKDNKTLSEEERERYSRQIILDDFSIEKQLKLKQSKILVIGAGGLGSTCLMYLSGAGIGTIGIVDNDNVEITNLHRQVIHSTTKIGINKAKSAMMYINDLNPNVKVIPHDCAFTNRNGVSIAKDYDMIIDCCDNPITRYISNDVAAVLNKPFISGASVRWDGQLSAYIIDSKGNRMPCYRCIHPIAPLKENVKKCAQVGVLGLIPGVIGALEANEAIKHLIGLNDQLLSQKLITFDGLDNKFKVCKLKGRKKDCIVCGDNPKITIDTIGEYNYNDFISKE